MSESELTVTVCRPDEPYCALPQLGEYGAQMLGWHIGENYNGVRFEPRTVALADMCRGEPPMDILVKTVSHEYLHDILEQEVSRIASVKLDNIVEAGAFIVDRPENHVSDDRPCKERWRDALERQQEIRQNSSDQQS